MSKELPAIKTPVNPQEHLYKLATAWVNLLGTQPKKESLLVLLAQNSLECGIGMKACWCYNFGNIKKTSSQTTDYCYYACNELLDLSYAKQLVAASPATVKITSAPNKDNRVWVWFYPKHTGCCFVAFETVDEGAAYYFNFIKNRYSKYPTVWKAVEEGKPIDFCYALYNARYFTADPAIYSNSVNKLYSQFQKLEFDIDKIPVFSQDVLNKIDSLSELILQDSLDDIYHQSLFDPNKEDED